MKGLYFPSFPIAARQTYTFFTTTGQVLQYSAGARIYLASLNYANDFNIFFGTTFAPNNIFLTSSAQFRFNGTENFVLSRNGVPIDAYGTIGVDHSATTISVNQGWAARNSFSTASGTFNSNDWSFNYNAFSTNPSLNTGGTPPIVLGSYQYPITSPPSSSPTQGPTFQPTLLPTGLPTSSPTQSPTIQPTYKPTSIPTASPSALPTTMPATSPTGKPTSSPTASPSASPTTMPATSPTGKPTSSPTSSPSAPPTARPPSPTGKPTSLPTSSPSALPTSRPTKPPTSLPTKLPTTLPTTLPTSLPTKLPTSLPTKFPTSLPTKLPTSLPTKPPTKVPTKLPTSLPTKPLTKVPTKSPTPEPTSDEEFCWRDSYWRGVGTIPNQCGPGREKIGFLCYTICPPGYSRWGFDCHQNCPGYPWVDDWLFCRNPDYGRGVGHGWHWFETNNKGMLQRCRDAEHTDCEMWGLIAYPKCRAGYTNFGCCLCEPEQYPDCRAMGYNGRVLYSCAKKIIIGDPVLTRCSSDKDYNAALCYNKCRSGYSGVGPVCWGNSPPHWVECGMGAAPDTSSCVSAVFDQVTSVGQVAIFVATLGVGGAEVEAANAAKYPEKISKLKKQYNAVKDTEKFKKAKEAYEASDNAQKVSDYNDGLDTLATSQTPADAIRGAATIANSIADPTGVSGVIAAYSYSKCSAYFK